MTGEGARSQPRVRARGIAAHVRAGAVFFSCQVEEISEQGAFLPTDRTVAAGMEVEVGLVKPGGRKALQIHGRVLRVVAAGAGRQPGIDVEFVSIDPEGRPRLVEWMEELRLFAPPGAAAAPVAPEAGGDHATAKLMLQVKGLLLEMDDLRSQLRLKDEEVAELKRQMETAEQLLGRRSVTDEVEEILLQPRQS